TQQLPDGGLAQRYEFIHALYRDVCYWRQAPGRRATLHRRLGEWLEALYAAQLGEAAPQLAHHFEAGADWPRAVTYLRLAADMAGRRYAPRETAALLQHALALVDHLPEAARAVTEIELLGQLATMYVAPYTRAIEIYEDLAARAAHYGLHD